MRNLSKTQLKKARRRQYKALRELAELYRGRAQKSLEMANLHDAKAMEYDDRSPPKLSRMPKRVMLSLDGTPKVMLEIDEVESLYPELYAALKKEVDARPTQ